MPVQALSHLNIRPWDLEATKDFFVDVVGLTVGYRPPVGFPGYWLYSGDQALVHLMGPRPGEEAPKPPPAGQTPNTGYVDHVAFAVSGLHTVCAHLTKLGIPYTERVVPRDGQILITVQDPNGVRVEMVFDAAEAGAGR